MAIKPLGKLPKVLNNFKSVQFHGHYGFLKKKKTQKKTKDQTNPWPLGFKLCLLMCLIQYRFLYEYSRRHLELAVPVILRILVTYKHLLEECCKLGNPLECHRRGVNSFFYLFFKACFSLVVPNGQSFSPVSSTFFCKMHLHVFANHKD